MKFNEFAEEIRAELEGLLKKETTVSIHSVTKNNGVVLHGITIRMKSRNVSPTIYLEEFYNEFLKGKEIREIVSEIYGIYENDTYKENLDLRFFTEYENAKENIVFKLVNYEKNRVQLEDIPHVRYLDLAIVFVCVVRNDELGNATILIRNNHLELWKQSAQSIYNTARRNTPKLLPPELKTMEEVLGDLFGVNVQAEEEGIPEEFIKTGMYILSNRLRMCGASVILYDGILKEFADKCEKDIIILPSSIHEVILLPYNEEHDKDTLTQMVKEVNRTQVEAQEVLSDGVYVFLREENKIVPM